MYFYATLAIGSILLYLEFRATKSLISLLKNLRPLWKLSTWLLLLCLGSALGFWIAFAEYRNPLERQGGIVFYSLPILAGATDGHRDFLSEFTIPALLVNFFIGLLAPVLIAVHAEKWFSKHQKYT